MMDLLVSDEYSAYKTAILQTYGETITPPRTGKPGRPKKPYTVAPADLQYATVHKTRHKRRVVHVEPRIVFGEEDAIRAALEASPVSTTINTAFVERPPRHRSQSKWPQGPQDGVFLEGRASA